MELRVEVVLEAGIVTQAAIRDGFHPGVLGIVTKDPEARLFASAGWPRDFDLVRAAFPRECTCPIAVAAAIFLDAGRGVLTGVGAYAAVGATRSSIVAWRRGSSHLAVDAIDPGAVGGAGLGGHA